MVMRVLINQVLMKVHEFVFKFNREITMMEHQVRDEGREQLFDKILSISRQMVFLADKSDWEKISTLQKQRQEMLLVFFAEKISLEDAKTVESGINEILNLDKTLMRKGHSVIKDISGELNTISIGQKVSNAYLDNS